MLPLFLERSAGRLSCHEAFRREGIACCCGLEKGRDAGFLVFFLSTLFVLVLFHNVSVCLSCGCCVDGALTSLVMAHHQLKFFGREEITSWWG